MNQDFLDRLRARPEAELRRRDGGARLAERECADGRLGMYTTSPVQGGPHAGRFLPPLFPPEPGGAGYTETTRREFATRKAAKSQAVRWYRKHSPKWAARHPTPTEPAQPGAQLL